LANSGEIGSKLRDSGRYELQQGATLPRILHSGSSRRRPGRHGEPADLVTGSSSALYDCDCGLLLDGATSYDCDCGLFFDDSHSYDCDCGLFVDSSRSYDCDCGLFLDRTGAFAGPLTPDLLVGQSLPPSVSLEGGWQAYLNMSGPVGVVALNPQAQRVLAAFEAPTLPDQAASRLPGLSRAVTGRAIRSLARSGLLRAAGESPRSRSQPSALSAWLHVTEACNLNCPYCYVRKRPTAMSRDVGRRAVEKLVETAVRHGYSALMLKYAGGEPTLSFPLVEDLHSHAGRFAAQAGLDLEGVLLSNGVGVSDGMLDFLAQTGLRLMISLDGGPDAHDRVRTGRDGRSTYDAVAGTVERALDRGLRPTVSITLTALALDGTAEAVAFALERDLPFNLNFYRERASGARCLSPLVPDLDPLVGAVRGIFALIDTYPAYPLPLAGILDRTRLDIPHDTACSAGRDYMAVSTRGQVSACQMLLEEPWASLADADPLDLIRRNGASIFAAPSEGSGCHDCPWRSACGGGCPLMRHTSLHAHYCQAYQILLPELVRLEARRLIAAHSSQPPYFQ
jgi:uncharacterized protein